MKKISIAIQWLVVLLIFAFILYAIFRPVPQPKVNAGQWNNWSGFSVISYAGIARGNSDMYVTARRLAEHLAALEAAGYETVTPEDILAFLQKKSPLPEKAVLLLFEGGRKEAFIRATPPLQQHGMRATLLVPTVFTKEWGGFFVKPKDIRKLLKLPQWNVGSMGHEAALDIPVDATGAPGRFLTQRRFDQGAAETDDAFQQRILDDYATSSAILEKASGRRARLYLYPFADTGRGPLADPLAEELNRIGVMEHYDLAITRADNSYNGPDTDPHSLARLRAPGTWSGERLIEELNKSRPRTTPFETIHDANAWLADYDALIDGTGIHLPARTAVWLKGTENWDDVDITATLSCADTNSVAALYARYTGPRSYLRLSLDSQGLRLQEKLPNRMQTLTRKAFATDAGSNYILRLRVRNNRAWVYLNNETVASSIPLLQITQRGRAGLGAERSAVQIAAYSASPLPSQLALVHNLSAIEPGQRAVIGKLVSPWFNETDNEFKLDAHRAQLLQAAAEGVETIPWLKKVDRFDLENMLTLIRTLDEELTAAGLKSLVQTVAIDTRLPAVALALHERGYRTLFIIPAGEAEHTAALIHRLQTDDQILINESADTARAVVEKIKRLMPSDRIYLLNKNGGEYRTATDAHQLQNGG